MKYLVTLPVAALLAFGLSLAAKALPTDNSEAGMPSHSVIGAKAAKYANDRCLGGSSWTARVPCGPSNSIPLRGRF